MRVSEIMRQLHRRVLLKQHDRIECTSTADWPVTHSCSPETHQQSGLQPHRNGRSQPLKCLFALLACRYTRCRTAFDCFRGAHHSPNTTRIDHWCDV